MLHSSMGQNMILLLHNSSFYEPIYVLTIQISKFKLFFIAGKRNYFKIALLDGITIKSGAPCTTQ